MSRLIFVFLLLASGVSAQSRRINMLENYDAETVAAHQEEGRTVVVQFHIDSSDLCLQQEAVLKRFAAEKDPTTPSFFQASMGAQGNTALLYGAKPSTLLVFRGKRLVGKETGITSADAIRELISQSVMKSRGLPRPRAKREFKPKR